ncbi:MAG: hypothetical protein H7319_15905 [Spirosoma sp.]|nr:hypothetical protein [Spirosoma sp.]
MTLNELSGSGYYGRKRGDILLYGFGNVSPQQGNKLSLLPKKEYRKALWLKALQYNHLGIAGQARFARDFFYRLAQVKNVVFAHRQQVAGWLLS